MMLILNAVVILFSLCMVVLLSTHHMGMNLYFALIIVEYMAVLCLNKAFRDATKRVFVRKGAFGEGSKEYEAIHLETLVRDLEKMEPIAFEYFIRDLFKAEGYKAKTTPKTKDFGADVIATKGKEVLAIQVKHRNSEDWLVSNDAVQQAVASMPIYKANHSMVITNGSFTEHALAQALPNRTIMIDGKQLSNLVHNIISNHKQIEDWEQLLPIGEE